MKPIDILNQAQTVAVIGYKTEPDSFAFRIAQDLITHGKTVYGVNPKLQKDEGVASIQDIEQPIDLAVFVVNPTIGMMYLDDLVQQGITHLWLQPGTISDALLEAAKERHITTIEACVLATYANQHD